MNNKLCKVKPQALPPMQTAQGLQVHGSNVEFSHDIFGRAGRTKFYVLLDHEIDVSTDDNKRAFAENDQLFIREALNVVNRLLDVYRDQDVNILGELSFHIISVIMADIIDVRIVLVEDDLSEEPSVAIRVPATFNPIGFGSATQRTDAVVNGITKSLKNGTEIPIFKELLSSSLNAIWRERLGLSCIESTTAFEAFVSKNTVSLNPSAPQDLNDMISKLDHLERALNLHLASKSKPTISWFSSIDKSWRSLVESNLLLWKKKCYEIRGDVIHRGSQVTVVQAKEAYESTIKAMEYIQALTR